MQHACMHSGLLLLELLRRSGPTGALLTHNLCSSLLLARRVLRGTDGSQRLRGEREVREGRGKRDGRKLGRRLATLSVLLGGGGVAEDPVGPEEELVEVDVACAADRTQ